MRYMNCLRKERYFRKGGLYGLYEFITVEFMVYSKYANCANKIPRLVFCLWTCVMLFEILFSNVNLSFVNLCIL